MEELIIAKELGVVFLAAVTGGYIALKLKQPAIVGYILAGIVISLPIFSSFINIGDSAYLAEIGIALLLFTIGIEFSFDHISRVKNIVLYGAPLQLLITTGLFYVIFTAIGFSSYEALIISSVFSLSSTALVVKILGETKKLGTKPGEIMLGWLILQDIAIVLIIVLLDLLGPDSKGGTGAVIEAMIKTVSVIFVAIYLGKEILPKIFNKIAKTNSLELLAIAAFTLCLVFAFTTEAMGLSFTLGAFLAGLMISDSHANHQIFSELRSIRDIFTALFFVSIGSLVSLSFLFSHLFLILAIVVIVVVVKFVVVLSLSLILGQHSKSSFYAAAGLFQIGEFAFVISKIASDRNWIAESSNISSLIIASATITFLLTPIVMNNSNFIYDKSRTFLRNKFPPLYNLVFVTLNKSQLDVDVPDVTKHVVICGYGRVGGYIGRALKRVNIPFVVIDMDSETIQKLSAEGIKAVFGDATNIDILDEADTERASSLIIAVPDHSMSEQIVKTARSINPNINIIARVHSPEHVKILSEAGVKHTIEPEFEAALEIVRKVLRINGRKETEVVQWLQYIKKQ